MILMGGFGLKGLALRGCLVGSACKGGITCSAESNAYWHR